jgi:hypothetical protein
VEQDSEEEKIGCPSMKRPREPAVVGPELEEMNGRAGVYHCRREIKSQQQATHKLDHKAHQHDPTKTVKKANVRRDIFGARVIDKALALHPLLKPIVWKHSRRGLESTP